MTALPFILCCLLAAPADGGDLLVARAKSKQSKVKKRKGKKARKKTETLVLDPEADAAPEDPEVTVGTPDDTEIDLGPVDVEGKGEVGPRPAEREIWDTVLVMDLRAVDFTDDAAQTVTTMIAELMAARPTLEVLTVNEVKATARRASPPHYYTCIGDKCLEEMAEDSGATLVLTGFVGRVDQEFMVNLKTYDAKTLEPGGSGFRRVATLGDVPHALPGLLAEVFGWADDGAVTETRFMLPEGRDLLFAVLDLRPEGVDQPTINKVARVLTAEIKKLEGATVMGREAIERLVGPELEDLRLNCAGETVCLGELGLALEVDKLVVGTLGKLGNSYIISLRLIDVRTLAVDNRMYESFQGLEGQLTPAMAMASQQLLGRIDTSTPGALTVNGNVTGGTVSLDRQEVGQLPILLPDLIPGRHAVGVAKEGFAAWSSDVYIEPGQTLKLVVNLDAIEIPPAWYEHWWLWTIVGAAVATGATVGVAFYIDDATKLPQTTGGAFAL